MLIFINALTRVNLSSLKWFNEPLTYYKSEYNPNTELCTVYYAPLNFRDIMLASGKLSPEALPGDLARHAYYTLGLRGQMKPGNSLLVHARDGDVGQAAIAISVHMSITVYTTVGSIQKRVTNWDQSEVYSTWLL